MARPAPGLEVIPGGTEIFFASVALFAGTLRIGGGTPHCTADFATMNASSSSLHIHSLLRRRRVLSVAAVAAALAAAGTLPAFPPAPTYTLYGFVRDQAGQTITAEGARIILLKAGEEVGRTPVTSVAGIEFNYELAVRIDHNRIGTTLYSPSAVPAQGAFSLAVEMNGARFYPIEVSGNLTAGKGAERVRLDLNLGEDTDRDGLPDVWEMWQLFMAGVTPDTEGRWPISTITRDGDYDQDGYSNYDEYVAGTFAGDATETFRLDFKEQLPERTRFEFFGITGKTYTIERSTNAMDWTRVPFAAGAADAAFANSWTASASGIVNAWIAADAGTRREFYRLTVR